MIVVLLPAFNEENSIAPLIEKLQVTLNKMEIPNKILILDDGSTDGTSQAIGQFSQHETIIPLSHKINRGLGETIRDLFEEAATLCDKEDIIIRMDCDDTHNPEIFPSMIEKIEQGHDVVIASRFQPGGSQVGVSGYRTQLSKYANIFMKVFFPLPGVWEYSGGFRAYRAGIIKEALDIFGNNFIRLKGLGFTCTLEKLLKLKLIGARFCEVPFVLRYDQKKSSSKMVTSITTFGYFVLVLLHYWPWGGWITNTEAKKLRQQKKR